MLRLLPFILIPILILGGLGYWRFKAAKPILTVPQVREEPIEVPKTLPQASIEDRVKVLEDLATKLVTQLNSLKSPTPQSIQSSSNSSDSKLNSLDSQVTELKARVSALEKATPAPAVTTASQSTVYIPLGSGGVWTNTDWQSLPEYEVSLNPDNFPNYSGMTLEVTFRLDDPAGTASVRLYNVTDSSTTSSQLDSISTTYILKSSSSFKLTSGTKTYRLQVKSSGGKNLFIQTARIKVSY